VIKQTLMLMTALLLLLAACDTMPGGASADGGLEIEAPILLQARPSPSEVTQQFLDAWHVRDYETMYALLSTPSQELYPFQTFQNRYGVSLDAMAFEGINYRISETRRQGETAAVYYDVTIQSSLLTEIEDFDRIMRLVETDAGWRIAWSPMDILDGLASQVRIQVETRFPQRADIYDRNGNVLVEQNGTVVALYAIQNQMGNVDGCIDLLANLMMRPRLDLVRLFGSFLPETFFHVGELDQNVYLENRTDLEFLCGMADTNDNNDKVVDFQARNYRGHGAAVHVTGFTGFIPADELQLWQARGYTEGDIVGRAGVERAYEAQLAGKPERYVRMVEPGGVVIRELGGAVGADPLPVSLTIDRELQFVTSRAMYEAFEYAAPNWASIATSGAAVVIDVNTGALLAISSYPTFEPSIFNPDTSYTNPGEIIGQINANLGSPLSNKAIQEQYAPGSVYKIISTIAVVNEGIFEPDTIFDCQLEWRGVDNFGDTVDVRYDWRFTDGLDPAGAITPAQALTASCNPFFWESGAMLYRENPNALVQYSEMFGLGALTGIESFAAEAAGNLAPPRTSAEAINNAIGQGNVQVTALQFVTAVAAVANRGTLYKPYIVQQVGGIDGTEQIFAAQPTVVRQIDLRDQTWDTVQEGMCNVISDSNLGTAYRVFNGAPYTACGKTGTAQSGFAPNAWFVAYAPAENPQIAVLVVVPNSREGSEVAAPITRRIMDYYFNAPQEPFPEWWEEEYVPLEAPTGGTVGG